MLDENSPFMKDLGKLKTINIKKSPLLSYASEVRIDGEKPIKYKNSGLATLTDWITRGF